MFIIIIIINIILSLLIIIIIIIISFKTMQFCCKAPEMFFGQQNFTRLFIGMGVINEGWEIIH